jgi:transcriptional regulator with XRE-family HTH domain
MRFRRLDYPTDTPIGNLGPAALDDLLEHGDLETWEPLVRAIARDPGSSLADAVLRLCAAHPMQGTSALWRTWIERLRGRRQEDEGATLAEVRSLAGLTQSQLAERLGMSQADVSKLERRGDVRLSTLQAYARALDATLHVALQWKEGERNAGAPIRLKLPTHRRAPPRSKVRPAEA